MDRRTVMAGGAAAGLGAFGRSSSARTGNAPDARLARWTEGPALPYPVQEIYPVSGPVDGPIVSVVGGFRAGPGGIAATASVARLHAPAPPTRAADPVRAETAAMGWVADTKGLPQPLHHPHAAHLPFGDPAIRALWVIGGYGGGADGRSWIAQDAVWISTETGWRRGPSLPKPIGEAVLVTRDGEGCHVIGGRSPKAAANRHWTDHADVADHFFLPWGGAQWERLAPLPVSRNSAAGGLVDGAVHVVSGRTVAGGPTAAHHVYDTKEDRWRSAPPYPDPQGGLAAYGVGERLYACGGETFAPRPGVVSAQCWSFGPSGDWRRETDMLSPRHGHGLVWWNRGLLAIGGAARPGGQETLATTEYLELG